MVESLGFASGRLKGTGNTYFASQRMILKIPFYLFPENKQPSSSAVMCEHTCPCRMCVRVSVITVSLSLRLSSIQVLRTLIDVGRL